MHRDGTEKIVNDSVSVVVPTSEDLILVKDVEFRDARYSKLSGVHDTATTAFGK